MKQFLRFCFALLSFFLPGVSAADFTGKGHVHKISEIKEIFANPNCQATASCDLKTFSVTKVVNEIWFSDDPHNPTYGNGVIMEYETDTVAALENYAIVQFKKGCVFHTAKNGAGKIDRSISDVVPSFGENIPFCFANWVIDSRDTDPAYNSDPEYGRFYLLRWNKPGSYDNRTQKFYGRQKPTKPALYMTDYPAGAFITGTGVKNVALEFKTCIYKAADVPEQTRRDDLHFATPLACHDWQNVYIYDFTKAKFHTDLALMPTWEKPAEKVAGRAISNPMLALLAVTLIGLTLLIYRESRRRKRANLVIEH